ncbi:hypothetical protein KKG31_07690 [Patescibacteria group bacterium]|nr:hypothetical protein [Patescibacteria group bacterium]MBU1758947.1 hypothetical protein [Patescibacteria group bacterium]
MFAWLALPIGEPTQEVFEKEYENIINEDTFIDQYIDEAVEEMLNFSE